MAIYRKKYGMSENFPVEEGQVWSVTEGEYICERWTVISARKTHFFVEIEEFFAPGEAPARRV